MLTKEECLEALTEIKMYDGGINIPLYSLEVIENLIDEHFSNPPLKFEELKEGMLVYDKVRGSWAEIDKTVDKTHDGVQNVVFCWVIGWDIQKIIEYKPNRFYRKEVQE